MTCPVLSWDWCRLQDLNVSIHYDDEDCTAGRLPRQTSFLMSSPRDTRDTRTSGSVLQHAICPTRPITPLHGITSLLHSRDDALRHCVRGTLWNLQCNAPDMRMHQHGPRRKGGHMFQCHHHHDEHFWGGGVTASNTCLGAEGAVKALLVDSECPGFHAPPPPGRCLSGGGRGGGVSPAAEMKLRQRHATPQPPIAMRSVPCCCATRGVSRVMGCCFVLFE